MLSPMINEEQKYMAQFFQISGFCCMTPLGNLILHALDYKLSDLNIFFFLYFIFSFSLFLLGILLEIKGLEHVEERRTIR